MLHQSTEYWILLQYKTTRVKGAPMWYCWASKSGIKLAHKLNGQNQRLPNAFKIIQNSSHKCFWPSPSLSGRASSPSSTQTISIAAASATLLQRRLSWLNRLYHFPPNSPNFSWRLARRPFYLFPFPNFPSSSWWRAGNAGVGVVRFSNPL